MKQKFTNRKHPLRGILKEIALEKRMTQQSVYNALRRGNPDILEIYVEKRKTRERRYARLLK
jgi:predicted DNA-binding protein YlxM (UPF0122 family)